ncbi:hypothetical protein PMAYCL1PPCAC_28913, partial [Pristionchus mayeri]
ATLTSPSLDSPPGRAGVEAAENESSGRMKKSLITIFYSSRDSVNVPLVAWKAEEQSWDYNCRGSMGSRRTTIRTHYFLTFSQIS